MDLLKFHPTDGPPQAFPDDDWPSEEERRERLSHLRWGHVKIFGKGRKQVIDTVPPRFLQPIVYSLLPNLAAFKAVLEFHNIGPGDGTEEQIAAFLKSQARGLIVFGSPRTAKTLAVLRASAGSEVTTSQRLLLIGRKTVSVSGHSRGLLSSRETCSSMTWT
jgi:hypothetical protein